MSPKESDDELIGFRDFIKDESEPGVKSSKKRDNQNSSFELLSFLESESIRLEKQKSLYEEKVYMLKNYPQAKNINFNLESDLMSHMDIAHKMLMQDGSPLMSSLNEILKQFKKD
jgi:hypothetical protein